MSPQHVHWRSIAYSKQLILITINANDGAECAQTTAIGDDAPPEDSGKYGTRFSQIVYEWMPKIAEIVYTYVIKCGVHLPTADRDKVEIKIMIILGMVCLMSTWKNEYFQLQW